MTPTEHRFAENEPNDNGLAGGDEASEPVLADGGSPRRNHAFDAEYERLKKSYGIDKAVNKAHKKEIRQRAWQDAKVNLGINHSDPNKTDKAAAPRRRAVSAGLEAWAGRGAVPKDLTLDVTLEPVVAAIHWVGSHVHVKHVKPIDAPCALAWSLLQSVKSSASLELLFWRQLYTEVLAFQKHREGIVEGRSAELEVQLEEDRKRGALREKMEEIWGSR